MEKPRSDLMTLVFMIVGGVSLAPWLLVLAMSAFLFDAPGSPHELFPRVVLFSILSYPGLVVFSVAASLVLLRRRQVGAARIVSALPLACTTLALLLFFLRLTLEMAGWR